MKAIASLFLFLLTLLIPVLIAVFFSFSVVYLYFRNQYGSWSAFPKAPFYRSWIIAFMVSLAVYLLYKAYQL